MTDTPDRAGMNADELRILAEASKLLARTEYRKDAARLNAIIIMEGGDDPLIMCRPDVKQDYRRQRLTGAKDEGA